MAWRRGRPAPTDLQLVPARGRAACISGPGGRDIPAGRFVLPDAIKAMVVPVLAHRLVVDLDRSCAARLATAP
jgi:hypothetical protein